MTTSTGTDPLPPLFASPQAMRAAFEEGLLRLLDEDLLGAFVLVLANATFEPVLFERLRAPLRQAFDRWCRRSDDADPAVVDAAPDDVAVFGQVRDRGFEHLEVTRWRDIGPWQLQFNPLRALRPPRMSGAVVSQLYQPFDAGGFHFDKPFLRRETFWQGELAGAPLRLLFNKFPFAELHGLLVPHADQGRAQMLDEPVHLLVWRIAELLGKHLPGLGFGYNAYGAGASVNHLHFQCFLRTQGRYPVESSDWRHNGGARDYPLPATRHDDARTAWAHLQALHEEQQAYNLLYRPGSLYVVARRRQGDFTLDDWVGGFAWSEAVGALTTFDEAGFTRIDAADIEATFARMAP